VRNEAKGVPSAYDSPGSRIYRERIQEVDPVQSAEVVPNVDGDYSVLVTRTGGRRAVSCDLDTADGALTVSLYSRSIGLFKRRSYSCPSSRPVNRLGPNAPQLVNEGPE